MNTLSNICRSGGDNFKEEVLSKTFQMLKETADRDLQTNGKRLENFKQDTNLSLLTSLAEFLMPVGNDKNSTNSIEYLQLKEFWELVQNGLVHTNPITRKRALYLLKRTTDMARVNRIDVKSCFGSQNQAICLYDSSSTAWNDYFLCIELMEETSVSFSFIINNNYN